MIALLILAFTIPVLIEVPGLIREKSWWELIVFSVLMITAFFISLMQILKIEIPNPVRDTQYLVKSLIPFGYPEK